MKALKEKTIGALSWSFVERIGQNGMQFVIAIILARMLSPAEFGLIAMLAIFIAVAQSFIDSGFGSALIQKKGASYTDECSIFYFNIFVAILAAAILCIFAPLIATFYHSPILIPLTRALSFNLVINAFGLIQVSLLIKRIDFKTQLKVSMLATVLSGAIGIVMAYRGFGVWSLVAQSLSQNFFRTSLLWTFIEWRPTWTFSYQSLKSLFSFGSKLLFSGLLDTIFQNIYLVVIGRLFSPADLGFYSRAREFSQLPVQNVSSSVDRVTFPVFSAVQDDKLRLREGVRKTLSMMAMLTFPMMVGLIVVAHPLILILIGEKWLPCVPYLQLLSVVGLLYPLHVINLNVLKAQGRSDLFFKLEIIKKIIAVIAIIITYQWGITVMIIGQIATSLISYYLNSYFTGKLINYSITWQIKDVLPVLIISCMMGTTIYGLSFVELQNNYLLLSMQVIIGIFMYILLCRIARIAAFLELTGIIKVNILKVSHAD